MGLTVSAEEIIRDRKILKTGKFPEPQLEQLSHFQSWTLLFFLSAIQTLTFVLIGHFILEIKDMTFAFWFVLFSKFMFCKYPGAQYLGGIQFGRYGIRNDPFITNSSDDS